MKKPRPSKALRDEVQAVLKKHGWSGFAFHAPAENAPQNTCPPGQTPTAVTVYRNGQWVTEIQCR